MSRRNNPQSEKHFTEFEKQISYLLRILGNSVTATMRINVEHLIPIGLVVGFFLTAILCLACSMSRGELLDLFRCCCCRRGRRGYGGDDEDGDPRTYETLNEFIFEAEDEEHAGFVAMNDVPTETSVQAVFPDLLGPDVSNQNSEDSNARNGSNSATHSRCSDSSSQRQSWAVGIR